MSEEITTTEETIPTLEVAPEVTDEQIAAALGVDVEYLKEVKPNIKGLNKFYGEVNKRNMELIEKQRVLEEASAKTPTPTADEDDELPELDDKSRKVLDRYIREQISPLLQMQEQSADEKRAEVLNEFLSAHETEQDVLARAAEIMDEDGLFRDANGNALPPAKLKANLNRAYKLAKADLIDPEAEAERIAAERLKAVEAKGEVVEVKPRGTTPATRSESDVVTDDSMSWIERMNLFSKTE